MNSTLKPTKKSSPQFSWKSGRDYALIFLGSLLQALALRVFLVPANLASGGVSGLAQIVNHYTGWPIGLMIFIGNLPLFLLGWRFLGGRRFAMRTGFAIIMVSVLIDFLAPFLPQNGVTHDPVLNTLYGAIISGIGYGLVYRGQGTSGGSDILARILNHWRGISITSSYLITDSVVVFLAGLAFSWENALYSLVMLYVTGLAAEAINEGSNVLRTVLVITSQPQTVAAKIMDEMERGVTLVPGHGAYTGVERTILYCVISRAEVAQIKSLVRESDPEAFMVIGHAHEALGEGFRPLVN
jgi:uncharacterized membrane-anchored protein YitT (DUF2179 family)